MLVDELNPDRSLSYTPLFQIMFSVQNNETFESEGEGREFQGGVLNECTVKFDLSLDVTEQSDGLALSWTYNY